MKAENRQTAQLNICSSTDNLSEPNIIASTENENILGSRPPKKRLSICLINPIFEPSFYAQNYSLPLMPGKKGYLIVSGSLVSIASLVSPEHDLVVIDENVDEIDFASLGRFDVIGLTGMVVQKNRMRTILERLKELPCLVVVGGPYVTCDEAFFSGLCDVRFVGEAEDTWPRFLNDLAAGREVLKRYEQETRSDMTRVPAPRFDLIKANRYLVAPIQFSRGCPFLCEFCDIIVMFGRVPRSKSENQTIAELEAAVKAGFKIVFLVDDNFIGNKKAARSVLQAIVQWQKDNGYPLVLTTEVSVNLADMPEVMELMVQANIRSVFIGIESPRKASLEETRKMQNVKGDSLSDKLLRIREAGLVLQGGFIVGFDGDDELIFDEQFRFIQENGIGVAAVSILSAIPTTPLHERLEKEGRIVHGDPVCNFEPAQMSRETLKMGYHGLLERLYKPEAFIDRVLNGIRMAPNYVVRRKALNQQVLDQGLGAKLQRNLGALYSSIKLAAAMHKEGQLASLGRMYVRKFFNENRQLGEGRLPFSEYISICLQSWHHFILSQAQRAGTTEIVSTFHYIPDSPDQVISKPGSTQIEIQVKNQ